MILGLMEMSQNPPCVVAIAWQALFSLTHTRAISEVLATSKEKRKRVRKITKARQ